MDRRASAGAYTDAHIDEQRPLAQTYTTEYVEQPLVGHSQYARAGETSTIVGSQIIGERHVPLVVAPQGSTLGGHVGGRDHHIPIGSHHSTPAYTTGNVSVYNTGVSTYHSGEPIPLGVHPSGQQHGNSALHPSAGHHGLLHGSTHSHGGVQHSHGAPVAGYPGTAGVVSSAPAHHVHHDHVQGNDAAHIGMLTAILLLCSFVLLVQASIDCDKRGEPWNYLDDDDNWRYQGCVATNVAYAVALAVISCVFTCVYIIQLRACASTRANRGCVIIRKIGVTILMILWLVGAFLCTFDGPYYNTGNGYYALWIGAFATVVAFGRFVIYKGLHDVYNAAGFDDTF